MLPLVVCRNRSIRRWAQAKVHARGPRAVPAWINPEAARRRPRARSAPGPGRDPRQAEL